jgi:ubiquinone/menaquinone biosynthesis C-methylase UbiE
MNSTPYSKLAVIYDKVMSHVNYKMWAEYINNLLQFADAKKVKILDISCGTGKHIKFLSNKRKDITGADLSYPMLHAAKNNKQDNFKLVNNDARCCAFKNSSFDVILMLYDSINYLLRNDDVDKLFSEIYRILIPGGIFIFDFVTEKGLRASNDEYYESNSWDGLAYERHSWFSKKNKVQHNDFLFLYNGNSYKESHVQQISSVAQWKKRLAKSKMQLSHEFSNFSFLPPNKYSERIHFVCKKEYNNA